MARLTRCFKNSVERLSWVVSNGLCPISVTNFYHLWQVIRLLRMLRIVTSPEDIISGVRYLITTLIRLFPKATDEISGKRERLTLLIQSARFPNLSAAIICDALDLLYETSRLPDAVEWDLYEDAFQVLGRRSFSYLLRLVNSKAKTSCS